MATEAYIPSEVTYCGQPVEGALVLTLYDPDGDQPRGSLTGSNPLPVNQSGGPLEVRGARDGKLWKISIAEVDVVNRSAVGCEFRIVGDLRRELERVSAPATSNGGG